MNLEHYPEELEGLFAKISDLLTERGVEAERAAEAAFQITEFMRLEWGGLTVSFPRKPARKAPAAQDGESLPLPLAVPVAPAPHAQPDIHDFHAQMSARAVGILDGLGLEPLLGLAIADLVRDDWSGQAVYVGKGLSFELARRDYAIWREWDGSYRGKVELIRRYRISNQWFYRIIDKVRKREFRRTQPPLPGVVGE